MRKRNLLKSMLMASVVGVTAGLSSVSAIAADVTLKLHQFLPPQANVPKNILIPWAAAVEKASNGRIEIQLFHAMSLGGKPPALIDQARDGFVDIVWTLPGYSPGRFPRAEVFELPFTMTNAEAASRAYWDVFQSDMKDTDFKDFKILGTWVHGPGVIHTKGAGIKNLEGMKGKKLRAPTRVTNKLLGELGAVPVGMPVPAIPGAMSKGVIDGAVIPWEVTGALKVQELASSHTEFTDGNALYTAAFVLAMNKAKWDSLPDDLKAAIDSVSGAEFSANAGKQMQIDDGPGRKAAVDRGNEIVSISGADVESWKTVASKVTTDWISEMSAKGVDGAALAEKAKTAIAKYTK